MLPKDPVDVAADFIGAIYKHGLDKIKSALVGDYFHSCQKQFVLSVPAVWSDKAKDRTLRAAEKAGIHPVTLIKEPEAAALYTLHEHEQALKVGDAFLVCDAGGGTIDLITYEVAKILPVLQLAEVVPGSGGMAGSLGLNKRFAEAVKNLVGEEQWISLKKSLGWSKAMNEFDKVIKLAFRGGAEETFFVSFPQVKLEDNPDKNIFNNCWMMTGEDMQGIFDPLITDVLQLVHQQAKSALLKRQGRAPKGIFLVGGFGSSQYLKKRLEKVVPGVQVIQPDDAWAAIVKGAVLSQIPTQATVTSTKAVRHYGIRATCPFDATTDQGRPTYFDSFYGTQRVRDYRWYIHIGDDLQRDNPIKLPFYRQVDIKNHTAEDFKFNTQLRSSDKIPAPTYPDEVKKNCTLTSDMSGIDKSRFKIETGKDGKNYYRVYYDLVMWTTAANLKFSLEFEGEEMGSVVVSYE